MLLVTVTYVVVNLLIELSYPLPSTLGCALSGEAPTSTRQTFEGAGPGAIIGMVLVAAGFFVAAVVGSIHTPVRSDRESPADQRLAAPSLQHWLGT